MEKQDEASHLDVSSAQRLMNPDPEVALNASLCQADRQQPIRHKKCPSTRSAGAEALQSLPSLPVSDRDGDIRPTVHDVILLAGCQGRAQIDVDGNEGNVHIFIRRR